MVQSFAIPAVASVVTNISLSAIESAILETVASSIVIGTSISLGLDSYLSYSRTHQVTEDYAVALDNYILENELNFYVPETSYVNIDYKKDVQTLSERVRDIYEFQKVESVQPEKQLEYRKVDYEKIYKQEPNTSTEPKPLLDILSESNKARASDVELKANTLEAKQIQNDILLNFIKQFELMRQENAKISVDLVTSIALVTKVLTDLADIATRIYNTNVDYYSKDLSVKTNQVTQTSSLAQYLKPTAEYHFYKNTAQLTSTGGISLTPRAAEAMNHIEKYQETKDMNSFDFFELPLDDFDLLSKLKTYLYDGFTKARE